MHYSRVLFAIMLIGCQVLANNVPIICKLARRLEEFARELARGAQLEQKLVESGAAQIRQKIDVKLLGCQSYP